MVVSLNRVNAILIYCFLRVCLKNKDYKCLMEKLTTLEGIYNSETEKLRSDLERLQLSEEEAKIATGRVLSLQQEINKLRKDLEQTQSEKKSIEEHADRYKQETEQVGTNVPVPISFHKGCAVVMTWPTWLSVGFRGEIQIAVCLLFIISVSQTSLPCMTSCRSFSRTF